MAGLRQQRVQHLVGAGAMVGARRLEQRDGLGDRTALAGEHALTSAPSSRSAGGTGRADLLEHVLALAGTGVPGP